MNELRPISFLGDYIDGQFLRPTQPDLQWELRCPGDKKDLITTLASKFDHVNEACQAAKQAYIPWSDFSQAQRNQFLMRLKEVYTAHKQELAETISRETGKPLWEGLSEAQTMIDKIDVTINASMKLVEDVKLPNALPGVDGWTRFKSRGVMAVVGPFNFPGHLPNGHIVPALATGNTVVFKPSEMTPLTGQLMAQMFERAEFPKGVFNLVQGKGETGRRLVAHEFVEGILFTGSYETGLRIKQETMTHFWKILALEMGGKNASIVWNDANMEKAIYENVVGSFLSAGQRCSCTSRLIVHRKIADEFVEKFYQAAKKLTIGYWKDNPFMGPVISNAAVENYLRFQGIAAREGAESIMRGKQLELDREGNYVTPSIYRIAKPSSDSVYQKTELFAPNVAIYTVDDFDEAIQLNNSSSYGLVSSVFTTQRELFDRAVKRLRVGLVNWNRSTVGASSKLPFGGMGKSGNDRPSAHFAVNYCTVPVSSLEDPTPLDRTKMFPGMNYPH
ncbi:MAG: succinylglutamate-semialdehyde dehydrogenase [Bdellovibrionales bacterium]|nr:succinylglutamate-semialdehyde dehydrogenase [Bdellovibrionales bacterium]